MLLDIKNMLRADHPARELVAKIIPGPGYNVQKAPTPDEGAERPPRKSSLRTMASELDNLSLEDFGAGAFNAKVEHQLKINAWKAAIRAAPEDPEFTFPPAPNRNRNAYGLVVREDSDLSTIFGSDYTASSTETIKVVDLFSKAEIHSKKNAFIPPLIIGYNDVIGDRRLAPKQDGFMYYDISVDPLHHIISCRGVTALPDAPSQQFLKRHAVRVFFELPPVPSIQNGPFYKYIGDYYLKMSETYLSKEQWAVASQDIKDVFVSRFIKANNKTDNYRTPNNFTKEQVHDLFTRIGNVFPLVLLRQAHHMAPKLSYDAASSASEESFGVLPSTAASLDSASVYSQESAPRDGKDRPFESYSAAAGLRVPSSPTFAPARRGGVVAYKDGAQVIYQDPGHPPCYSEGRDGFNEEEHVLERSVFSDDSDDECNGDDSDEDSAYEAILSAQELGPASLRQTAVFARIPLYQEVGRRGSF